MWWSAHVRADRGEHDGSAYTGVNCTLTLLTSSIRRSASVAGGFARRDDGAESDARFADDFRSIQSDVTSSGANDSGLFEINLRDERYLPFEGAGVIGRWRLELPQFRAFDYDTVADVVHRRTQKCLPAASIV